MTIPEITAYVMALPVDEVRRLTATEIMGWVYTPERKAPNGELTTFAGWRLSDDASYRGRTFTERDWRPDEDRNQSRMVTDKVGYLKGLLPVCMTYVVWSQPEESWDEFEPPDHGDSRHWETAGKMLVATADQESRAALIAHMIHAEESKNVK